MSEAAGFHVGRMRSVLGEGPKHRRQSPKPAVMDYEFPSAAHPRLLSLGLCNNLIPHLEPYFRPRSSV